MSGMVCTNCYTQTDIEFDTRGLDASAIIEICKHWRCNDCLDQLDFEAIERGEHPPTQPQSVNQSGDTHK